VHQYEKASKELVAELRKILEAHHHELAKAKVSVELMVATAADELNTGDPSKVLGGRDYQVHTTEVFRRRLGERDLLIVINGELWALLDNAERVALLDEALHTREVKLDAERTAELDAAGRPVLRKRPPYRLRWYPEISERNGDASPQARAIEALRSESPSQIRFDFGRQPKLKAAQG